MVRIVGIGCGLTPNVLLQRIKQNADGRESTWSSYYLLQGGATPTDLAYAIS
jgi:hypothetical protein